MIPFYNTKSTLPTMRVVNRTHVCKSVQIQRNTSTTPLGDRMKSYEEEFTSKRLDPTLPYIIRLDGCRFSQFTKPFKKPCDERINRAMVLATADLFNVFSCATAYTVMGLNSEINPATKTEERQAVKTHAYGGKMSKIISVAAGFCSTRFNYHLSVIGKELVGEEANSKMMDRIFSGVAHFDARAFSLPNNEECLNNILWRMTDCKRNSIALLGHAHFPHKLMHGWHGEKIIQELKDKKDVDYERDMPPWFKYGVLLKKKKVLRPAINPQTNATVEVFRNELCKADADILLPNQRSSHEDAVKLLLTKRLSPEELPSMDARFVSLGIDNKFTEEL